MEVYSFWNLCDPALCRRTIYIYIYINDVWSVSRAVLSNPAVIPHCRRCILHQTIEEFTIRSMFPCSTRDAWAVRISNGTKKNVQKHWKVLRIKIVIVFNYRSGIRTFFYYYYSLSLPRKNSYLKPQFERTLAKFFYYYCY
jgi:hypothetical protein